MKRLSVFLGIVVGATVLAGCDFSYPMVDGASEPAAMRSEYPRLVPITGILAGVDTAPARATDATVSNLEARVANLRARAIVLRRPVVDTATLTRMRAAINRLQG